MEASALPRRRAAVLPRSRRLLSTLSDERLVDQIRRGNEAAFEVVFDRHHRAILSFCRHMLGSQEEAEDAVQQTFTSAFSALHDDDRDIRLKAWLYAIARNKSLSILRARREQPAELDEQATAGLSEEVQQRADLRELLADLRTLPDDQREALVLFELGDLSHAEIAGVIGVEPMKVKALVFQARTALIENRDARAIPCDEIREQLATATGGELRRGPLRRHLKSCEGCSEYRDMVKKQRRAMAALLPVIPTAGLKAGLLSALGIGGGGAGGAGITTAAGGTLAGGGVAAGGGATAAGGGFGGFAAMGASKIAVSALIATGAVAGGGYAVEQAIHHDTPKPPAQSEASADPSGSAGSADPAVNATPIANTTGGGNDPAGGGAAPADDGDKGDDRKGDGRDEDRGDRGRHRGDGKKHGRRGGAADGRRNEGRGNSRGDDGDDKGPRGRGHGNSHGDNDGDDNRGHGNDADGHDEDNPGRGNANGRGDGKKDGKKGGRGSDGAAAPEQTAPAPAPPVPADDDADDEGDGRKDDKGDKDRLTIVQHLGEAAALP